MRSSRGGVILSARGSGPVQTRAFFNAELVRLLEYFHRVDTLTPASSLAQLPS